MSDKGTLLIFAYECYPYNRSSSAIGAQRPYHFAKNLADLGWKVMVLCCDYRQRRSLTKQKLQSTVQELYETHQELLKKDAYTIIPLPSLCYHGIGDYIWSRSVTLGAGDTYVGKSFPYSIVRKMATFYNQLFHGDYSYSWNPVAEVFAERVFENFKVDVLLGEHSPDAGIILANQFSRKYDIPWVADFRDPVLWPFKGLFKSLYKPVVKKIVGSASVTINVNPYWTSLDALLFEKEAHTVLNGYDEALFKEVSAEKFPSFTVSYFGSINQEFQDIQPSIDAFAAFLRKRNYSNDITLFYRGLHHHQFLTYCEGAGIPAPYLNIGGWVDRKETVAYMKGSAALLIYSIPSYKARNVYEKNGFYPGKVFEYIGAGAPMLLYPSDHGLLASLITDQKRGLACSSMDEAVSFLEQQYQAWKEGTNVSVFSHVDNDLYSRRNQTFYLDCILFNLLPKSR